MATHLPDTGINLTLVVGFEIWDLRSEIQAEPISDHFRIY
jgi:hypothetical protein